jgi:hypothetical protein
MDFTYVRTSAGFTYTAFIVDVFASTLRASDPRSARSATRMTTR